MAIIKSFASYQNLSNFGTFVNDQSRTSEYFRITEFKDTFTGGKNGFLIEGSEHLKETTEIKIEILDVNGNPIYYEPGNGIPEYYEGISKIVSVHVYEDTPIGLGKITILGELKTYIDESGVVRNVPTEWSGVYNVKWERTFNVNKNLANETIVRFYKRPKITIDEINKPIFNITTPSITQTGLVEGIPQQPVYGTDIRNWTAGTLYKLKITDGSNWTSSVDENLIEIPSLGYTATIKEVLNNKEIFVDIPYAISSSVSNFPPTTYTTTFDWVEGQTIINSALTGSFAKIQLSDLKTFVGDVARVKVYRKSRNEVGDYQFIQDTKLESTEILKDITTTANTELSYGQFTESNIKNYWVSGSNTHPMTINVDKLNASVKVDYTGTNYDNKALFITSQSFSLTEGVEYALTFKTLLSGSVDPTKTLKAYFSGSDYPQQTIVSVTNSAIYTTKQNVTQNVKATKTGDAKLVFEFTGDDWYLANVSLQNAQETSFSPDEFTLIQDIPRKLASETYDFKFEFYDINNNYIPVDVKTSKTFTGGNSFTTTSKILTFESDRTAFRFSSGSFGNPAFQQVGFSISRTNLTGSVTYASAAFDSNGNYIVPASYTGTYPGALTNAGDGGASLTIANFSGSMASVIVGSITYTASCDGLNEYETIYRFEDGDNAPGLFTTSNANQFIYKATDLSLNPLGQIITIEAKRKNLASTTGVIEVNSGSLKPPLTIGTTDASSGVTLYTLAGSAYPFLSGSTTYSFTGSDQFGNKFSDAVTITPVKILDGLSVSLTNENASLPALSTGFVASGSFVLTSGSVSVKVGNETITHSNGLIISNSFDVVSAIATGLSTGSLTYSTADYFITRLDADSGSLELRVRYKDGAGDTTDVTKVATYTKNKKAAPVLSFVIGNNNQTATAKSTGAQIDAFVTASLSVIETYDGISSTKTLVSAPDTTTTNSYTIGNKTTTTIALPNIADGTDSVDISIMGSVVDSENTTRFVYGNISLAKAKKAVPNVVITATPQAQSVLANSAGVQTGTLSNVTISALEGSTDRFTSMTGTYSGFSTNPTISGNTLTMTSAVMNAAEASVTLTVTHTDSEGTTGQTKTIVVRATKVVTGANGSPGATGNDGRRTATGLLYYQLSAATAPPTPTATSYTFSTNTFANLTTNWALGAPTFAAGNSNKYWYSTYTAVETTAGGNTAVPTFSTVTQAIGFTGLVTFTSADNISDGTNTSNIVTPGGVTNHIGGANVTTINGGKISTGVITSTGYTLTGADTLASGSYTGAGTIFNLDNGSLRSKNFYITSAGDAFFRGNLSATSITTGLGYTPPTTTQVNDATKTAGSVGGWTIDSNAIYSGTKDTDGYTAGGITLNSGGSIHSKNFYIDTAGDAFFKGNITGASGTFGGSIRIGSGESVFTADTNGIYLGSETFANAEFRVTPAGELNASGATISGTLASSVITGTTINGGSITGGTITGGTITGATITAGAGVIGGWTINQTTLSSNSNSIKLNPSATTPGLEIYDESNTLRVLVSNQAALSNFGTGGSGVTTSGIPHTTTLNNIQSTNNANSTYLSVNLPADGLYSLISAPAITITNAGIYNLDIVISQAQLAAVSAYIVQQYNPYNPYQYYSGGGTSKINFVNTQITAGVSVRQGSSTGTEVANFGTTFGGIASFTPDTSYSESTGVYGIDGTGTTRIFRGNFTAAASTTYYFIPYISNAFSTVSRDYYGDVSNFSLYVSFNTPKINSITLSKDDNRVELVPGGFQVVASNLRYIKVARTVQDTFVEVGGGITATGNITAFASSDKRLKENIIPIENALDKIEKLDGVEFDWTDEYIQRESNGNGEDNYFFRKHDVGLIAQQVESILPEVVATRDDGYLAIKYEKIVPLLVECIKELKKEINELKENK